MDTMTSTRTNHCRLVSTWRWDSIWTCEKRTRTGWVGCSKSLLVFCGWCSKWTVQWDGRSDICSYLGNANFNTGILSIQIPIFDFFMVRGADMDMKVFGGWTWSSQPKCLSAEHLGLLSTPGCPSHIAPILCTISYLICSVISVPGQQSQI